VRTPKNRLQQPHELLPLPTVVVVVVVVVVVDVVVSFVIVLFCTVGSSDSAFTIVVISDSKILRKMNEQMDIF
jgi:hypothetical protein